jgi:serine/threonine protein phosphatase PrpC
MVMYIYDKPKIGFSSANVKNEDRIIITNYKDLYFFGVYDGHGGNMVVKYIKKFLFKYFLKSKKITIALKLTDAYRRIETELKQKGINYSGSTASTLVLTPNNLYICHIGDSRIIALKNKTVKQLTRDHKPYNPSEYTRIKKCGGVIRHSGVYRVGPLAVSRSIGDLNIKSQFNSIIAIPETKKLVNNNFHIIILASDGLWDVMTNDEVMKFITKRIKNRMTLMKVSNELVSYAKYHRKSIDDISVVIITT